MLYIIVKNQSRVKTLDQVVRRNAHPYRGASVMSDKNHKHSAEPADKALAKTETPSWLQPFEDMDEWFDELQKRWLSHRFFGRGLTDYPQAFGGRIPKVDVIDREKEVCVHAELPGVTKDNLSVTRMKRASTTAGNYSKVNSSAPCSYLVPWITKKPRLPSRMGCWN